MPDAGVRDEPRHTAPCGLAGIPPSPGEGQCMHLASWGSSGLGSLPRVKLTPPHTTVGLGGGERGNRGCVLEAGDPLPGEPVHRALCGQRSGVSSHRPWPRNAWQVVTRGSVWVGAPPAPASGNLFIGVVSASLESKVSHTEQALCGTSQSQSGRGRARNEHPGNRTLRAAHPGRRKPGTTEKGPGTTLMS